MDYVENGGKSGLTLVAYAKKKGELIVSAKYCCAGLHIKSESFLINYTNCSPGLPYAFIYLFLF